MEIKPDRMISLGYGKYWRSDAIVGLVPIDEERGPGRRTEVYTATLEHPIVASRGEQAILEDMAYATDETLRAQELREIAADLVDALHDIPDVVKRMVKNESDFDPAAWARRLRTAMRPEGQEVIEDQNDLFA